MSAPLSMVNPLQGTASDMAFSTGNTLPLIARPFGLHHWSVQTARPPWLFHPSHDKVLGIRLTHQPSPWMQDYGSLLVIPFCGPAQENMEDHLAPYHLDVCLPNHLRLTTTQDGITCEMSPSDRGALFLLESSRGHPLKLRLHFASRHTLQFSSGTTAFCGSSHDHHGGVPENFGLYFHGEFSEPPARFVPLKDGGYWTFGERVRRVEFRLAASFIDPATAIRSLRRELQSHSLPMLREEGASIWNRLLGHVPFEPKDGRHARTFYSCLYRCLLFPRQLEEPDENGLPVHYSPYDGLVHSGPLCTDNGFWDTHRTVYPLLAKFYPDVLLKILNGWLNACHQAGWAPKWASPGLRDCMVGTHFDAVVADAIAHGITGWDVESAFAYLWKNATEPSDSGCHGRKELTDYLRLGYVPADRHSHSVSSTLDYAYDDFCISQVAKYLGRTREAEILLPRTKNYRNIFDPSVGFMRERLSDGSWKTPFREFSWGGGYIEGGPWQYAFHVPHDPEGLAALFGGPGSLCRKLDAMLAIPPVFEVGSYGQEIHEMTEMARAGFGQYAHSNQPVHGFLFLYALMGEPEKTSYWVGKVADTLYSPDRFPGDEDNGEMAAWFIWASLGIYPQCPGKPGCVRF